MAEGGGSALDLLSGGIGSAMPSITGGDAGPSSAGANSGSNSVSMNSAFSVSGAGGSASASQSQSGVSLADYIIMGVALIALYLSLNKRK